MAPARKHRPRVPEHQSYIFQIESSQPSYTFATDQERYAIGPYREHLELIVDGRFLFPDRLQGHQGKLTFLGDRRITGELNRPEDSRLEPLCVGTLTIWGQTTSYLGSLPLDVIWQVGATIASGAFRMIVLYGEALYRGKAKIQTVNFDREINPEDW